MSLEPPSPDASTTARVPRASPTIAHERAAAAGIAAFLDARGDTRGRGRHRVASVTATIIIALVDMVHSLFPSTR